MRRTVLVINIERDGYQPYQIGNTMTIRELREVLDYYPEDMAVYIGNDRHYTFSAITEDNFEEYYDCDEDEDDDEDVDQA